MAGGLGASGRGQLQIRGQSVHRLLAPVMVRSAFRPLRRLFQTAGRRVEQLLSRSLHRAVAVNKGGVAEGIGRSRGGLTTKIVAVVDALGCLVRFVTVPGQAHDLKGVELLLEGLEFGGLVRDRAFDADWLLEELDRRGSEAVIPAKRNRAEPREHDRIEHDRTLYGWRHLVDSFFSKIREFRAAAIRYGRTMESYVAAVHLVAGVIAAK